MNTPLPSGPLKSDPWFLGDPWKEPWLLESNYDLCTTRHLWPSSRPTVELVSLPDTDIVSHHCFDSQTRWTKSIFQWISLSPHHPSSSASALPFRLTILVPHRGVSGNGFPHLFHLGLLLKPITPQRDGGTDRASKDRLIEGTIISITHMGASILA